MPIFLETREDGNGVRRGGVERRVTFDVGPSLTLRHRFKLGVQASGTARCFDSHMTLLRSSGQQGSVHEASVQELEHHVRQARTADKQLRRWHLRQARRQVAHILSYEARLRAPPVVVDACYGTGTSVALFHLKYSDAIDIGIDRDKDRQFVEGFIPGKYWHWFIFIKDDVRNISVDRLSKVLPAGSRVSDIVHFHSLPPCESMSRADRFSTHRDGIKPISAQAIADDEALEYTVRLARAILKAAPTALISLENPKNDVFSYLAGVRELLKGKEWLMLTASYCTCANQLDIGFWPQKDSSFLVCGVPRGFSLPMCNNDCAHLVPGTSRHRVVLCSDRRMSSDGCGSMTYLRDAALDLGIDHWPIPPYSPRFNLGRTSHREF